MLALCIASMLLGLRLFIQLRRKKTQIEEQNKQILAQHATINETMSQLQQATQSKLTFFTNVSHDLRTPLTLIAEPVEQLANARNLTDNQRTILQLAQKNVKILMRLINQILDFRRYENGKLNLNLTEVNMAAQLRDWTEALQHTATRRHLHFNVQLPEDINDFTLAIDVEKMERVLFNLLSNAFKFTPENGQITVCLSKGLNTVHLTVQDNGKGINAEDIHHIFERFFKGDKVNPQGSGIGLALTKAFVELHGGKIEVESAVGVGTTFKVQIPIKHVSKSIASTTPATNHSNELTPIYIYQQPPTENQNSLLVIDDNSDICTLITQLMSSQFTVIAANNGTEGIHLAMRYVPDLIICDMMMPGIDGLETCKRLKEEITTSHIPILMLTACALDEQRIQGYNSGADAYITKPFSSDVLLSRCNALIANRIRLKNIYSQTDVDKTQQNTIEHDFGQRLVSLIKERLSDASFTIENLAEALSMSRVQLYRKTKALTNYTPTELLRNMRLQHADHLLKTTDASISEIGYIAGFSSPSYFIKCYREYYGETPKAVRDNS